MKKNWFLISVFGFLLFVFGIAPANAGKKIYGPGTITIYNSSGKAVRTYRPWTEVIGSWKTEWARGKWVINEQGLISTDFSFYGREYSLLYISGPHGIKRINVDDGNATLYGIPVTLWYSYTIRKGIVWESFYYLFNITDDGYFSHPSSLKAFLMAKPSGKTNIRQLEFSLKEEKGKRQLIVFASQAYPVLGMGIDVCTNDDGYANTYRYLSKPMKRDLMNLVAKLDRDMKIKEVVEIFKTIPPHQKKK